MQTRLRLFLDWGISFGDPYLLPERAARKVAYASKEELEQAILKCTPKQETALLPPPLPANQRSFQATRSRSACTQIRRSGQLQEERPDLRTKGE